MTTQAKPVATAAVRTRTKKRLPDGKSVPLPPETVRSTACPLHARNVVDFCGVNEHGWLFFCHGLPRSPGDDMEKVGHYLVSTPAVRA